MNCDPHPLGAVQRNHYDALAAAALGYATTHDMPVFALSMYPNGVVYIEPVDEAAEEDLIGVFKPAGNVREVAATMRDCIRFEAVERGFRRKTVR